MAYPSLKVNSGSWIEQATCPYDNTSVAGATMSNRTDYFSVPSGFWDLCPNWFYERYHNGVLVYRFDRFSATQFTFTVTAGQSVRVVISSPCVSGACLGGCGECDESNPCPEGEKCVDGVCVPCGTRQATHYQIRWEFDRIVALDSDGNSGNYHLSQIFSIPVGGVDDVVHRFAGFLAPYVASRIRFCDANGAIRPYRGAGYIGHSMNPDGSGHLMGTTSFSATGSDVLYTAVTALTQSLGDGVGTASVNTLVSFSASDEILDSDCETIEPPGDDDGDEVKLPEGENPPDGENPPEKKDGEKGKRKDDPNSVETCECYDIINQRLTDINNNIAILNDNLLDQLQVHNDTFAIFLTKMQEWTRYLSGQWREIMLEKDKFDNLRQKRFKQFLTSGSGEKIADSVQRATDALYVSASGSAHDGDSIADLHESIFHSSLNPDLSITDAIENIEPVTIENEYRTQSHRVIDNLDEVVNKL